MRIPIYTLEASLGEGRVLAAPGRSKVRRRDVTLVDRGTTCAHIDPLTAHPRKNAFLRTVVPFLERVGR